MISGYNTKPEDQYGVKNLFQFVAKELTMVGFLSMSLIDKYDKEHRETLGRWIAEGSFKPSMEISDGIETSGQTLVDIFDGKNLGKSLVKVADP